MQLIKKLFMAKMKYLLKERIDRARDGRSQTWIIGKMAEKGIKISNTQFSRKKHGYDNFKPEEIEALSEILEIDLNA